MSPPSRKTPSRKTPSPGRRNSPPGDQQRRGGRRHRHRHRRCWRRRPCPRRRRRRLGAREEGDPSERDVHRRIPMHLLLRVVRQQGHAAGPRGGRLPPPLLVWARRAATKTLAVGSRDGESGGSADGRIALPGVPGGAGGVAGEHLAVAGGGVVGAAALVVRPATGVLAKLRRHAKVAGKVVSRLVPLAHVGAAAPAHAAVGAAGA
mmetsp:Transcript_25811/g.74643  ORF Transcript_25811/g.74643 Transcript_25811/m.74643 type:complete len:206 (+) Transcript_25811:63-680(+)